MNTAFLTQWGARLRLNKLSEFDRKVESDMLDFSWKVFSMTGNVDTYLLVKELERDSSDEQIKRDDSEDTDTLDVTIH